jgi:hypothetical protein
MANGGFEVLYDELHNQISITRDDEEIAYVLNNYLYNSLTGA